MNTAPNFPLEKKLNTAAWVITVAVLLLVGLMRRVKFLDIGVDTSFLPAFHALLNSLAAVFLILALVFIKQKKVELHRRMIYAALSASLLFLLSYVVYHFTNQEVLFGDTDHNGVVDASELAVAGTARTIYLVVLFSHIVLAALILPFILLTFIKAYTGQYDKHRKMARWVYPVWLYVAITGPICYFLLEPYYP